MTTLEILITVVLFVGTAGIAFALEQMRERKHKKVSFLPPGAYDAVWRQGEKEPVLVDFKTVENTVEGYWKAGDRQLRRYRLWGATSGRMSWPRHRSTTIRVVYEALSIEVEAIPWDWPRWHSDPITRSWLRGDAPHVG